METFLHKIGPWIPLMIAAGYFAFLIMTYVKVVSQLKLAAIATVPEPEPKPEG